VSKAISKYLLFTFAGFHLKDKKYEVGNAQEGLQAIGSGEMERKQRVFPSLKKINEHFNIGKKITLHIL
jgi:hypothetical protein